MAMPATLTYTPDEYLAIERAAAHKSELIDGRIVAMSGGSRNHSLIAAQLIRLLGNQQDGQPCEVHGSDMRVERFTRDGDDWVLTAFDGLEATVGLTSIGCDVRLDDVYSKAIWGADQ